MARLVPRTVYRGEKRNVSCLTIKNQDIGAIWFSFDSKSAEEYTRSYRRANPGVVAYLFECELRLEKVLSVEHESDIYAMIPGLSGWSALLAASRLLRADGFDGIYNDVRGAYAPEIAALEDDAVTVIRRTTIAPL